MAGRVGLGFTMGDVMPDTQLARYDSAAVIVPCDHGDDLFCEGLVSNRISDTLACGPSAISDHVGWIAADFHDAVVVATVVAAASMVVPLTRSR